MLMMYNLQRIVLDMRHVIKSRGIMVSVDQFKLNPLPSKTGIINMNFSWALFSVTVINEK